MTKPMPVLHPCFVIRHSFVILISSFVIDAAVPELPDITVYVEALERRILGEVLRRVRIRGPFLLRTFEPPVEAVQGKRVIELRRIGKRIAIGLEDDLWLVLHLMIAGRLHWKPPNAAIPGKRGLAAFDFESGTLLLTEEGTKKRASLHVVAGKWVLDAHNPGGLEVLQADLAEFAAALRSEGHTLKRALTSPHLFSGIGNAYSDEILHRAQLSPLARSQKLSDEEIERLHHAVRGTLTEWTARLRAETGDGFPKHVTAFREGMAVHGRYGLPCPVCGAPVQRICYAENETNYCARCQTGGKVLADRSLSRLLKDDWPRTIEEWEGDER
jgi:formamidopyrimidine-DNA glycosylase